MTAIEYDSKNLTWRKALLAKAYGEAMAFREVWRVLVEYEIVNDPPQLGTCTTLEKLDRICDELAKVGEGMQMSFSVTSRQLDEFKASLKPK